MKNRRLKKPIRMALRFTVYAVTAAVADLMVVCTFLQMLENVQTPIIVGTCLAMNIALQYLFFRREACIER